MLFLRNEGNVQKTVSSIKVKSKFEDLFSNKRLHKQSLDKAYNKQGTKRISSLTFTSLLRAFNYQICFIIKIVVVHCVPFIFILKISIKIYNS